MLFRFRYDKRFWRDWLEEGKHLFTCIWWSPEYSHSQCRFFPPFFGGGGNWHSRFLYYWHKETSGIQIDENCSALICKLACKEINAIRIFCDMVAAAWINDVNVKRIKSEISDCINHIDHTLLYSCSHFIIPLPAGATI